MKGSRGITLIELLVVSVILGFCLLPAIHFFYGQVSSSEQNWGRTKAVLQSQNLLSQIGHYRWDETVPPVGTKVDPGSSIGIDASEPPFDDLDDWNGYSDTLGLYQRTVTVDYVEGTGPLTDLQFAVAVGTSDYKRVTVTTQTPDHRKYTVSKIFANKP